MSHVIHYLNEKEHQLLSHLRTHRREKSDHPALTQECSLAQRMADRVAKVVGSWTFIIVQSALLVMWMTANVIAWHYHWDPYPFILLNLVLSFQAAFTAPIIMMSQNRQSEVDRFDAQNDYEVNRKSELEVEALHEKIDLLREQQISELIATVKKMSDDLEKALSK